MCRGIFQTFFFNKLTLWSSSKTIKRDVAFSCKLQFRVFLSVFLIDCPFCVIRNFVIFNKTLYTICKIKLRCWNKRRVIEFAHLALPFEQDRWNYPSQILHNTLEAFAVANLQNYSKIYGEIQKITFSEILESTFYISKIYISWVFYIMFCMYLI